TPAVSRTFRQPELVDPTTHGFVVPPELSADAPPEARGVPRDGVRLLVARPGRPLRHLVFSGLPGVLRRGDLLVVNDSDTEPAALDGHRADGRPVVLHVSGPTRRGGEWIVELRSPDGRRVGDGAAGEAVRLPGGVTAFLLAAHPDPHRRSGSRLWRARLRRDAQRRPSVHARRAVRAAPARGGGGGADVAHRGRLPRGGRGATAG